jgi:hypothetical protein
MKPRARKIDVVIGGNLKEDSYDVAICYLFKDGPITELKYLSRKDMLELKSAIDCALEDFK